MMTIMFKKLWCWSYWKLYDNNQNGDSDDGSGRHHNVDDDMLQNLKSAKLRILNPGQLICEAQVTFKLSTILMINSKKFGQRWWEAVTLWRRSIQSPEQHLLTCNLCRRRKLEMAIAHLGTRLRSLMGVKEPKSLHKLEMAFIDTVLATLEKLLWHFGTMTVWSWA